MTSTIKKYFPEFSTNIIGRFADAMTTYKYWNEKINVISRKDIANLETHHFLHALALLKLTHSQPNISVLDVGTGGGIPAIPLAIVWTNVHFTLLEATKKKLKVAKAVASASACKNVSFVHGRTENHTGQYDIITGRAVASLPIFAVNVAHLLKPGGQIYYWCGCEKSEEFKKQLQAKGWKMNFNYLKKTFKEPWFAEKMIVNLRRV